MGWEKKKCLDPMWVLVVICLVAVGVVVVRTCLVSCDKAEQREVARCPRVFLASQEFEASSWALGSH
jgi:hypothetical protein